MYLLDIVYCLIFKLAKMLQSFWTFLILEPGNIIDLVHITQQDLNIRKTFFNIFMICTGIDYLRKCCFEVSRRISLFCNFLQFSLLLILSSSVHWKSITYLLLSILLCYHQSWCGRGGGRWLLTYTRYNVCVDNGSGSFPT